ncbi:MAG: hypothetical protein ABJZ55_15200 [Fuerstiella sp.]
MNITRYIGMLAIAFTFCGCTPASEPNTKPKANPTTEKDKSDMTQVIEIGGSKVAEITKDGEIWIGGDRAGTITLDGEIWVGGEKEGDLTTGGEVWKAGEKVGDITDKGEVWHDGNEIGTVEKDGTIWNGSSRAGTYKGGDPRHAAVIVFYGFFETSE